MRGYAGEVLRGQGYVVLEAGCGIEALLAAADHAGPIHLLVTDVVMPDMSGRAVAQRLADPRPDAKTLYMSGYTDDVLETHGASGQGLPSCRSHLAPWTWRTRCAASWTGP